MDTRGVGSIRTNRELTDIFPTERIIKTDIDDHATRTSDDRTAKKFLHQVLSTRAREKPRKRWIDCVDEDVRNLRMTSLRNVAEDRLQWWKLWN